MPNHERRSIAIRRMRHRGGVAARCLPLPRHSDSTHHRHATHCRNITRHDFRAGAAFAARPEEAAAKGKLPATSPVEAPSAPCGREARSTLSNVLNLPIGSKSLPTVTQNGPEQWPNSTR